MYYCIYSNIFIWLLTVTSYKFFFLKLTGRCSAIILRCAVFSMYNLISITKKNVSTYPYRRGRPLKTTNIFCWFPLTKVRTDLLSLILFIYVFFVERPFPPSQRQTSSLDNPLCDLYRLISLMIYALQTIKIYGLAVCRYRFKRYRVGISLVLCANLEVM